MNKNIISLKIFLTISFAAVFSSSFALVKLPRLISDGMILQRNSEVKIWGWADPGEKISIQFLDNSYYTGADDKGVWQIILKPAAAGGPYEMIIAASNTITLADILIGEVWVCSGQSNMEYPMDRVWPLYQKEIDNADYSEIRQFFVPQQYDFNNALENFDKGDWKKADRNNILRFSAVAWFFAMELYEKYKVPIGLINASLGGSPVEAWMSERALQLFPDHLNETKKYRDPQLIIKTEEEDTRRISEWYKLLNEKDEGLKDPSIRWQDHAIDDSGWEKMTIPGYWSDVHPGTGNGAFWFRKDFYLNSSVAGKSALLELGRIVDADSVFINNVFVGATTYQYPRRWYKIPGNVLKEGKNTIVIRIISNSGKGGFVPDKPYELRFEDGHVVDLRGEWKYKKGADMEPLASQTFIRWKPMGLYNAMIHPLRNYCIKGVIWYQGESNTGRPQEYTSLFPAMIADWREVWGQGDFPFLFVQLSNFMEAEREPAESQWAALRESQLKALTVPQTGMAVIIDKGEWNDIHPLNKKDVGKRLALQAMRIAYGENIIASGPLFRSMEIKGRKIILSFDHGGGGLVSSDGSKLRHFAIAGDDKKFVWAKAEIKNNRVVVWNDAVKKPVAVRYAWADNPDDVNFYNKNGLPSSPFRTDAW